MSPAHSVRRFLPLAIASVVSIAASAPAAPVRSTKSQRAVAPGATSYVPHARQAQATVPELVSRGDFAMRTGQYAEAITVFEQALQSDRNHSTAWGKLAFLYMKEGRSTEAVEAFKKAKLLGDANGGIVTRNAAGGPMFP